MRTNLIFAGGLAVAAFLTGCETIPPGAERGPHRTMAYDVLIEANEPGVRIEANHEYVGDTPVHLKIFGDPDGTFHDFGSPWYIVEAFPANTNQFVQRRVFGTGHLFGPEDYIPRRIFFDMNKPAPTYGPETYGTPGYPGPYYYGPRFYGPEIYIDPPFFWHHRSYRGHW